MDENIFELLDEWDLAGILSDFQRESEIGKKIELLRKEYREKGNKVEKIKIVGVFKRSMCSLFMDDEHFGNIFNLEYSGRANSLTDRRLYMNQDTYVWLDYAVYE